MYLTRRGDHSVQALIVVSLVIMEHGICNIVLATAIHSLRLCAIKEKKREKKKEICIVLALLQKVNKRLYESSRACSEWANVQMNKPLLLRGGFAHSSCPI